MIFYVLIVVFKGGTCLAKTCLGNHRFFECPDIAWCNSTEILRKIKEEFPEL